MVKAAALIFILLAFVAKPAADSATAQLDPVAQAHQLVKLGKLKHAENLLRSASQSRPASSDLHGLLGEVLLKEQKYEEAVQE